MDTGADIGDAVVEEVLAVEEVVDSGAEAVRQGGEVRRKELQSHSDEWIGES